MKEYIDAASFKEMILCADAALHNNIQAINDLNVFPVPDGDTGTNMGLTINNAAAELRKRQFSDVASTADCVAGAMLRGARGNSGVILSLLFRGISKRLKGLETAGTAEFTGALTDGVQAAYKAVMKPAEGTILTVSRLSSQAAQTAADHGASLVEALTSAVEAGEEALADTMNINPVLKKAGVIDAGGKGYMIILSTILTYLRGDIESPESIADASHFDDGKVFQGGGVDLEDITFTFDTVYIVRKAKPDVDLEPLRKYLSSIGDSLVISDDDEIFKVHVHTDIPGTALNESQKYGTLELAKIENMRLQAEALKSGGEAMSTDDLNKIEKELDKEAEQATIPEAAPAPAPVFDVAEAERKYGIVTVCAGDGMETVFRELGVDGIVTGGQTMNPSTEDILKEVEATPAETVFVFPNNKNIIMAAQQCEALTDKKVVVIPTRTVPEGISALLNFNPDEDEETLTAQMNEAIGSVHTAMVTYAARDSDFDGHAIHAGEYLALLDGALLGSYASIRTVFKELSWAFDEYDPEFITVYYGEDVTEDDANEAAGTITGNFPDAEVTVVYGGQPVYYYMISAE
ncbi:MAG: DAK2 domain-containing protein [Oscillospiraceae bacterium]|nr:DAK2 domain-containing protein [Oscillospiraceae bacterium]